MTIFLILLSLLPVVKMNNTDNPVQVYKKGGKTILQSDVLTTEISGTKPVITFYYTGDTENYTHFRLSLDKIYEYDDDIILSVEVNKLPWAQTDPYVIIDDEGEEIGYSVRLILFGPPVYQFGVMFEVNMYHNAFNTSTSVNGKTAYTLAGRSELGINVIVWNWTFAQPSSSGLALEFKLSRDIPGETTKSHSSAYQQMEDSGLIQIIGVESELVEGFYKWSNEAVATFSGISSILHVEANIIEDERSDYVSLKYGRYQGILQHYMSIGVIEENAEYILIPRPETINLPIVILTGVSAFIVLIVAFLRKPPRED
ncbi:hypothetical protein KAX03_00595 [Candidatus Bathyarchaeota archaeon]|nr:hypothetical protein [Candidatus Bathyarchaeota archaeon]